MIFFHSLEIVQFKKTQPKIKIISRKPTQSVHSKCFTIPTIPSLPRTTILIQNINIEFLVYLNYKNVHINIFNLNLHPDNPWTPTSLIIQQMQSLELFYLMKTNLSGSIKEYK